MKAVPLKSEISGTVWKIEGAVGAEVETDDVLLILESMKMEIPVLAPRKGRIVEFRVGEGDSVAEDQVVLLFEPS
ncbi:acetyl-CoA carboxylase biotin carboxyl carrier protein subunit [Reyranella sp.]|uniref:acetyl-CoA carboxylase biotin carboxyl carrier protein subunit n=1 Tax=Reyranella sp. TaxID=1929291 RepID=UPI0027156C03|nr:acetyl-CoA carboxylase biotin carboxyl carrier protein subunit [Reyranella sp.]MDO8973780.1 acetyl-CoA carboxylase biotin carboxyl carrier protein subunit [Reyranella sp.]